VTGFIIHFRAGSVKNSWKKMNRSGKRFLTMANAAIISVQKYNYYQNLFYVDKKRQMLTPNITLSFSWITQPGLFHLIITK